MRLSESDKPTIHLSHFDTESITINHQRYTESLVILPSGVETVKINHLQDIGNEQLLQWISTQPDMLIIGTGQRHVTLPKSISDTLSHHNISVEVMSTPSACRCLCVLLEEERRFVAVLIQGARHGKI